MIISLLFHLFVLFFNNSPNLEKKFYLNLDNKHKLVLNVSNIYIEFNNISSIEHKGVLL